ncbi:MAG: hypothetical protein FWC34_01970 [Bacteroidetes bacterium]|nr:hypothetical protein [Bacteroidota bacterium]MCL2303078.1 hypothetical protein [Lentimicrobiaceae bacterium]
MKKVCILFISLILIGTLKGQSNTQTSYISKLFKFSFSAPIHSGFDTKAHHNIYATHDSVLFVMNQQGFGNKTSVAGCAKISKLNALTGVEEHYFIQPSPAYIENGGRLNRIWIWALAASDSLLFLAIDEEIWMYHLTAARQYEYLKTIPLKDVSKLELVNNDLHAFVENDEGFDWIKINLLNDEVKNVRQLTLKDPFFLQIFPVKVIAINNNSLYFLQQNAPAIEKYSLTGELLANYNLKIPNWQNIPEETTQQLNAIEDITERNYAFPKFSIFDNNFIHLFYVFPSERFFMIAIDRDEAAETFITPYFIQIIGDSTIVEPYSVKLHENEKWGEKYFPFSTAGAEGNLIFAQLNEYVTQINRGATVSWQNKTQKEFQHEVNLYHRDNEPVEKIETYHFIKNYIPVDSVLFLDYDNHIFPLNNIKKEKAIFIISQHPQCAACLKALWNYFTFAKLSNIDLYNVASDCPTYLMKKENIKEVNTFLKTEYTPLFMNTKQLNSATKRMLTQKENPIVLLFNKKLQHIEIISSMHIIGDVMGNLTLSFIQTIKNFVEH